LRRERSGVDGRIGVNTGEVVTATSERLATGDAVNVAARFQQAAAPGEVLIGAATHALVAHNRLIVTLNRFVLLEATASAQAGAAAGLGSGASVAT
jgi:class 3 adenylate cyclase